MEIETKILKEFTKRFGSNFYKVEIILTDSSCFYIRVLIEDDKKGLVAGFYDSKLNKDTGVMLNSTIRWLK